MKHTDTNVYTPKQKSLNANVTKRMHSWFWDWSRAGAAPEPLLRGAEPTILSNHLSEATLHMSSLIVAAHIFLQQNWWILRSLVLLFYCVVQRHTPVCFVCVTQHQRASPYFIVQPFLFQRCYFCSFSTFIILFSFMWSFIGSPMPSPSCPSVIDQSHPQSANPHNNPLLANIPEPNSEEEEEEEEYAARLYLAVTCGKETLDFFLKTCTHFGFSMWAAAGYLDDCGATPRVTGLVEVSRVFSLYVFIIKPLYLNINLLSQSGWRIVLTQKTACRFGSVAKGH